ncbi:iron chelate uptake ABC transporter family permease subunit [Saccharicrinis sp. FJH62]|uniref:iron chelate uptake ABC transporter family permease subunit n=1 Tax=Saccharicrinis sp. FJH62 TaxID=3344657 RepID=UPI0035D4C6BD
MKQTSRFTFRLVIVALLTVVFFIANLLMGSVSIPLMDAIKILFGSGMDSTYTYIILDFRLPKALVAIYVGAGLSVSGLMMQTLFRNPLAGPFVLGISSGASLGVALYTMAAGLAFGTATVLTTGALGIVFSAIIGAALVMALTLLVSLRVNDTVSLLIVGIMFGSITGAIVTVLQYFSDPNTVHNFLVWTFGSLSGITWSEVRIITVCFAIGIVLAFALVKNLNAMLLGENYARSIGVNNKQLRIIIILITSLIAGTLTAFVGPIGFIGVAVPHMARFGLNSSDHKKLMPLTALYGASLMLLFDIISQLPGLHNTMPINAVTALFGAPVVIWVIFRSKSKKSAF